MLCIININGGTNYRKGEDMRKIAVPIKEENCVINELSDKEMESLGNGGCFGPFFFFKRCISLYYWKIFNNRCKKVAYA